MSRLFITPREIRFINDIVKEVTKDVIGQVCFVFPINEIKTQPSGIYNEALRKVFDNPIKLDCIVDASFQTDTVTNQFGSDAQFKLDVFVQHRDLVDKGIALAIGDVLQHGDVFYEITDKVFLPTIYGEVEHKRGIKLTCVKARESLFKALTIGPTDIARPDADAVQTVFHQQRGQAVNAEGPTGDIREMQDPNVLGKPITGAKEVSPRGDTEHSGASSFYGDEES